MKKIFLVLLCIAGFITTRAQARIGVKAGFNLSSFNATYAPDVSYSSLKNINAGLVLSLPLSSRFSIQPEAVYSGEGGSINIINVNGAYNYQLLNIPVLIKYMTASRIFIETGPQAGFLLGAQLKEDGFSSANIKGDTKSTTFSWAFGLGYQLPMNLGLDARYNVGLTDVAKGSVPYNGSSIKNNVLQIGIYYLFSFSPNKN
jgi:hypothetical protein